MFAGAGQFLITAEKGGVVKAKGDGEKEKECTTECKSRRRRDEKAPGHLITRAGREEVMRKGGGEEVKSVRCMCDVCAAHGDRAAVRVDVDAQGSGLREDESHFPP